MELYEESPDGGIGEQIQYGALPSAYGLDFLKNEPAPPPPVVDKLDTVDEGEEGGSASSSPMRGLYAQIKKNKAKHSSS